MGQYEVIGGIISPVHDGYKKKDLEAGTHRLNMIKVALQENDWVKVSDWELKQESWTRTRHLLQHHQVCCFYTCIKHRNLFCMICSRTI